MQGPQEITPDIPEPPTCCLDDDTLVLRCIQRDWLEHYVYEEMLMDGSLEFLGQPYFLLHPGRLKCPVTSKDDNLVRYGHRALNLLGYGVAGGEGVGVPDYSDRVIPKIRLDLFNFTAIG